MGLEKGCSGINVSQFLHGILLSTLFKGSHQGDYERGHPQGYQSDHQEKVRALLIPAGKYSGVWHVF